MQRWIWIIVGVAMLRPEVSIADVQFEVPEGFEVSRFADDTLAHNIYSLTIDSRGRVVVSGPGYVKILHDDDDDGDADRFMLFSDKPASGAQGLYFVGNDLLCTGDNGLWRFFDRDGDGQADGEAQKWADLRNPEHGAHGIVKGPDGWFYVICGNDAGVSKANVTTPTSPVKDPICGAVLRFAPDGKQSEVFAHGFRNPYDLAFNADGRLFTVDSDGERDHHLPWYSDARLFDIAQGMEHGWLLTGWQRSWNRPEWFYDNVDRADEIGRGSPTGVEVYSHSQFPERYRNGVFSCCWTFGRVYFHALRPAGSSYQAETEVFLKSTGDTGFAPVDLAVGPKGDLFVAIGGRGTQGGVFRVRYTGETTGSQRVGNDDADPLEQVLSAPQPLSSWSRARWEPLARELGERLFVDALADTARLLAQRLRAVEILTELYSGPPLEVAKSIANERNSLLTARLAWALSRSGQADHAQTLLAEWTHGVDAVVLRAVWEALAVSPEPVGKVELDWEEAARSADRRVRWAMLLAARGPAAENFHQHAEQEMLDNPALLSALRLAQLWVDPVPADPDELRAYVDECLAFFVRDEGYLEKLQAVRLIQRGLGDIRLDEDGPRDYPGYAARHPERIDERTRRVISGVLSLSFPSKQAVLNRELARVFSMLESQHSKIVPGISQLWTEESEPADDVHYLIVASRLPGPRDPETTQRTVQMLWRLYEKLDRQQMYPSRNFGARVNEALAALTERDDELLKTLVADEHFGSAHHVQYLPVFAGELRTTAIRKLIARAQEDEQSWTSGLLQYAAELPAESALPVLRQHVGDPALRDVALVGLAKFADPTDRGELVGGLGSVQPEVVTAAAKALTKQPGSASPSEIASALTALKRFCQYPDQRVGRDALVRLLRHWTQADPVERTPNNDTMQVYSKWLNWFVSKHPDQAQQLVQSQSLSAHDWGSRLAVIRWDEGNAERGKAVFEKLACHRCHVGARRLGPSLAKVTQRLSREDVFESIVNPSKSISPTYQTTMLATTQGTVYNGLLIYESPESTLLQTGPDTTVRILGADVIAQRLGDKSLMPDGLLDGLKDEQISDLYAYLKTLDE